MKPYWLALLAMILPGVLMASSAMVEFSDESLRVRYQQLIQELRCPKCQNQNLADSNAPISLDLRAQVQELLERAPGQERVALGEQDARAHVVLDQTPERLPVRRDGELLVRSDDLVRLRPPEVILREVQVHLVPVKVRVVRRAVGVVHADRALPSQHPRRVRHDPGLMQRRLAVHQEHVAVAQSLGAGQRDGAVIGRSALMGAHFHRHARLLRPGDKIDETFPCNHEHRILPVSRPGLSTRSSGHSPRS